MKAIEVYNLPSESETKDLSYIEHYQHLPEVSDNLYLAENNERVLVKTLKDFDYDGRRYWEIRTLWFDDKPVMIIQNAGRDGTDHVARFITDQVLYFEMISYINSLFSNTYDVVDMNTDIPALTEFYGQNLFGEFTKY